MTEPNHTFYVQLNRPTHYCVVRSYSDGSAIIAIYGLFPSGDTAKKAAAALLESGVTDALSIEPVSFVYTDVLNPANPPIQDKQRAAGLR